MRRGARAAADADEPLTAALRRPSSASIDCLAFQFTDLNRSEDAAGLVVR